MSLTASRARYLTRDGELREATVGVSGHDRAALMAEAGKLGRVVDLGTIYEAEDVDPATLPEPVCRHGAGVFREYEAAGPYRVK